MTKAEVQIYISQSEQGQARKCGSGEEAPGSGPVGIGGI